MHSLLHSLQIGTLATWLSVAGFGTVGVVIHGRAPSPVRPAIADTQLIPEDFTLGSDALPDREKTAAETPAPAEPLPAPPEMPALAEIEPLPVIPDFPAPQEKPAEAPAAARAVTRSAPAAGSSGMRKPSASTQKRTGTPGTGASGMSNADRLAAGRMPSPTYPPYSRRNGQTGTVVVEFTVDANGRVISAYAKSPSPYPLLNAEAVSTVRGWRFPPGGVMKLQRPIVFQLR